MADEGDLAYLQPDFEPASLTVARLRNVLLTHGVSWPSSAKKADLVNLFNTELKPRARKILAQSRKTQRSSKGIEDAPSSLASSFDTSDTNEKEEEVKPSTVKKPTRGRPKKSVAPLLEDSESTLVPKTASKPTGRSKSRGRSVKQTPAAELGTSPTLKHEISDPTAWREYTKDSPFSRDNPFQSGSSPMSAPPSAPNRRKTDGSDTRLVKPRSTSSRRKTEQTPLPNTKPNRKGKQVEEVAYDHDVDISEEFTPEEQKELEEERRKGNVATVPVRRTTGQDAINWKSPILVLILMLLSGLALIWRQEKFNVGYCGIGIPSDDIYGLDVPPWAEFLRPQCEQCPQHAICRESLVTDCEHGFVLRRNLLSVNGLLPFVPWCEADGEKAKRVKAVADRMEDQLRERKAQVECGVADAKGKPIIDSEISEDELKAAMTAKRRKGMTDEEFDSLFQDAVPELSGRDDVVITLDETSRRFSSTSLTGIPLGCSLKRTLGRFARPAIGLSASLLTLFLVLQRYKSSKAIQREAKIYASDVFASLADYAAAVAQENVSARDGFVSVTQLRDDVLRNEFSSRKRKALWAQVEKLVEENSNVRTRIGSLDSGDVGRGWKWIGSVRQLEEDDGASRSRRGSGRYSFPSRVELDSSPMSEIDVVQPVSFKRWNDVDRPKF